MGPGAVLVTGAAGFAGSHLLEHLTTGESGSSRKDLVAWSRSAPPPSLTALAAWQRVDLLDRDLVRRAIHDLEPSAVYHCAGAARVAASWTDSAAPLSINVLGTHFLFDALRRANVRCRVLLPGSAMIYRPASTPLDESAPLAPASPYAVSKLAQEQLGVRALAEDGIDVVLTRSFNHTGPRQAAGFFAPDMARQIAAIERGAEPVIKVGNLDAARDLTDVRDMVRAYALLMKLGTPGTVYNVASGVSHSMRAVLDGLVARSRVPVRIETDAQRMRPHDVPFLVGDASRLRAATGWSPEITFDRMLDDLVNYWRAAAEPSR
jgi:GDP-4-dehydro-6-deoxy-D-mannose reductase